MAVTPIVLCDPPTIFNIVVKYLGIADENTNDGSVIASGAPYTIAQIKAAILQSDYEIAQMIVKNLGHPYRTKFLTDVTGNLAHGDLIPAHLGPHSRVMVKHAGTGNALLGSVRSFDRLSYIRRHLTISGNPTNLYAIHAGRIYFANDNDTATIDIPFVDRKDDFSALSSPIGYMWGVIAGAIVKAAHKGFDTTQRGYFAQLYSAYENDIREGKLSLTEPEQQARLET